MWEEAYNAAQAKKQYTVSGVRCVHQVSCNTKQRSQSSHISLTTHTLTDSNLLLMQIHSQTYFYFAVVANYATCLGSAHMAPFTCTR